ncbi:hypothetical protein TK45_04325 [Bowmanella sp. JS7-9]|nr:hypothetical protein TK45_04325 [Bowmanella sp. JS7-9]
MSQQKHEQLSAFMDGEHADQDLIKQISQDGALHGNWQRYHLVRATLRNELPPQIQLDIATSVAAALEHEPVILAPNKSRWQQLPLVGNVIPMVKNVGQLAIAASVAVAVVFAVQQYNQPVEIQPGNDGLGFGMGVQGGMSPVSLEQTQTVPVANQYELLEQRRRINALLIDHHQQMRLKQLQMQSQQGEVVELEPEQETPQQ